MTEKEAPTAAGTEAVCPYCGSETVNRRVGFWDKERLEVGRCSECRRLLVRVNGRKVYPDEPVFISRFSNLPRGLASGLAEACSVAEVSPNASCSLLLGYLEKMCDALGAEGATLGQKVADLKARGKIPEEFASLFQAPIPHSPGQKADEVRQQAYDLASLAAYLGPHLPFMQ